MRKSLLKLKQQKQRSKRIRAKLRHHSDLPRISVFRSNQDLQVQIIDDAQGSTVVAASLKDVREAKPTEKMSVGIARAYALGKMIAQRAKEKGVEAVVFDRGRYAYHGRVKALADGAREGGLKF